MKKYLLLLLLLLPFTVFAQGYEIVSGDLNTVGSVVKIADEEFYVLRKEDDTHVRLLAKYSLGVGEGVTEQVNKQSENAGVVPFYTTKYWWDETLREFKSPYYERKVVLGQDNMDDKSYVYDENSTVYPYVNNYVKYLNEQGVCVTGELLRGEDLKSIGCNDACIECHGFTYYCYPNYPEWIGMGYWIGDAPMYQPFEKTDPFESDPSYMSYGSHYFFAQAPVARVTRNGYGDKQTIRPVITLDLEDTCKVEEPVVEEVKPEVKPEVKGVEENPKTGINYMFTSITIILAIGFIVVYIKTFKQSYFTK